LNSPRTLESCKAEGILSNEILHIPKEDMDQAGIGAHIIDMRFEYNENKRAELIDIVKKRR
jgi:hypothetical protein